MNSVYSVRFASHPSDFKSYDTKRLRELFLIEDLFEKDSVRNVYSHYDRMIIGGAMPVTKSVMLEIFHELKANFYLERRELGIINVGPTGAVTADGVTYALKNKEALYIGKGTKEIVF